jgi:hypothetical protein
MLDQYHDKYPVGQKLQDLKNNQAAIDLLAQKKEPDPKNEKPLKEPKPKTIMVLLICCFVALYLVCMGLATDLVKRDYGETFKRNIDDVIHYISANFDEERTDSLNDIYDIGATKNKYQYISAAVYNVEDELVGVTESYLCLEAEDETYYLVLEDYFSESDLATLLYYVRDTSDKYTVEAHLDKETKALAFLHFDHRTILGEHTTVFEWKDAAISDNEEMIVYRKKTAIRDIFSIPYYRIEDDELWIDDTIKGEEYKETFSYETQSGEKQDYVVSVQSAEYGWKAAVNILTPVYFAGLVVMLIGICTMIYCLRRCSYTNVEKKNKM